MVISSQPVLMEVAIPYNFYFNEREFLRNYEGQVGSFATHVDANLCGKTVSFTVSIRSHVLLSGNRRL
jgi:hypothetical protein